MELYEILGVRGSALSGLLQAHNGINELLGESTARLSPSPPQRNNIGGRFLDNAKPINFKLSKDYGLAGAPATADRFITARKSSRRSRSRLQNLHSEASP